MDDCHLYSTPEEIEELQRNGYLFNELNEDMKIKNSYFLGIYEENKDSKVNLHNFRTGTVSPDRLSDDDLRLYILQIIDTSSMMETVRFIERFNVTQINRIREFALIPIKCYLTY